MINSKYSNNDLNFAPQKDNFNPQSDSNKYYIKSNRENHKRMIRETKIAKLEESFNKVNMNEVQQDFQLKRLKSNSKIPQLKTEQSNEAIDSKPQKLDVSNLCNLKSNEQSGSPVKNNKRDKVKECLSNRSNRNNHHYNNLKDKIDQNGNCNNIKNEEDEYQKENNNNDVDCSNYNRSNNPSSNPAQISQLKNNISNRIKKYTQLHKAEKRNKNNKSLSKMSQKSEFQFNIRDKHESGNSQQIVGGEILDSVEEGIDLLSKNHPFQLIDNLDVRLKELNNLVRLSAKLDTNIIHDKNQLFQVPEVNN